MGSTTWSWDVCEAHILQMTLYIAQVIAAGTAAGLFHVADVKVAAKCASAAMLRFFHPQMIAQINHKLGATLDEMIAFVIACLGDVNATCRLHAVEQISFD